VPYCGLNGRGEEELKAPVIQPNGWGGQSAEAG